MLIFGLKTDWGCFKPDLQGSDLEVQLIATTILHVGRDKQPCQSDRNQSQNNPAQKRLNHVQRLLISSQQV